MVLGPVPLGILQSPDLAAFDEADDALVAFWVDVAVRKLRAVRTLLRVAKRLLASAVHIHPLLNFEVCVVKLGLLRRRSAI